MNSDLPVNAPVEYSDSAFIVAGVDYYRLHKFEDVKKLRKDLKELSTDKKKSLLQQIKDDE